MFFSRLSRWFARQTATGKGHTAALRNSSRPARLEFLESRRVLTSSIEAPRVADYEGDSGSKFFDFWVTLTQPISAPLDVAFSTADSNNWAIAEPGTDYAPVSGTLHFAPGGLTSQLVSVEVFGDTRWEPDEAFDVVFTPSDGSDTVRAEGFIAMDDEFPQLSIDDVSILEGGPGEFAEAVFTVTRSGATGDPLQFVYQTVSETASDSEDYVLSQGLLAFEPGEVTKTIPVVIAGDNVLEPDETFRVEIATWELAEVVDGVGIGTIVNDEPAFPVVLVSDNIIIEGHTGQTPDTLLVELDRPLDEWAVVHISSVDGAAIAGLDYVAIDEDVFFAPGETQVYVPFYVLGDREIEDDETFTVEARSVTGELLDVGNETIVNDDFDFPPIAVAGGPYSVAEGGQVVLSAAGSWDREQPAESLLYAWDVDYDGVTFDADLSGRDAVFSAAGIDGPASRTIAVRVTDNRGQSSIATAALSVGNAPPQASAGPDQVALEGGPVALSGSAFDPGFDAVTYHWRLVSSTNGQTVAEQNTAAFEFVPVDDGVYTFELTATDDEGASSTDTVVVTAENVSPSASVSGDATGYSGQTLSFEFSAGDVSPIDLAAGFTYEIDWGDGSALETVVGGATMGPMEHRYTNPGQYVVSATTIDKDGGHSAQATHNVEIVHALLHDGNLYVGGSDANDFIWINAGPVSGSVTVNVNGESHGTFAPSGRIVVYGGAGNDTIALHPDLALDAWLFGGDGGDVLISADGNDVLSGGAGADWLWANRGRDLLFGGAGLDQLDGGNDEDILISGTSTYEADEIALAAIMAEWTSPRDFVTRQRNLRDGSGSSTRLNDEYFLVLGATVFDDGQDDSISGGGGKDWTL